MQREELTSAQQSVLDYTESIEVRYSVTFGIAKRSSYPSHRRPKLKMREDVRVAKLNLCYQASCVTRFSIYRLCMGNSLSLSKCLKRKGVVRGYKHREQHRTKNSPKPAQIIHKTQEQPHFELSEVHFHIHNFLLGF